MDLQNRWWNCERVSLQSEKVDSITIQALFRWVYCWRCLKSTVRFQCLVKCRLCQRHHNDKFIYVTIKGFMEEKVHLTRIKHNVLSFLNIMYLSKCIHVIVSNFAQFIYFIRFLTLNIIKKNSVFPGLIFYLQNFACVTVIFIINLRLINGLRGLRILTSESY